MALEAHVMIDGTDVIKSFSKLGDAMAELNAASFAGFGGIAVVAVGKSRADTLGRIVAYTGEEPTEVVN